jgi:hypothetical protein
MRRTGCISIFLVLVLLASGCIGGAGDQTVLPPLPGTGSDSTYAGSGGKIALAVSTDWISTSFPEARELLKKISDNTL